jgi:hypothetical protein
MTDATGSRAAKRGKRTYDGAHYHAEEIYVCDCGFTTPCGMILEDGSFPGGKVMVEHLETAHGWVRGKSDASYRGEWGGRNA